MSHLALKDLFSGFFVIDDEEEVEVPDKQQQVNEAPAKEQSQQTTKQNAIKSVPQKSASRYTTTSEERNNRMSNYSKNNSRNVVTMNNATPNNASQKVQKCVYSNHVFFQIHKILLMSLKTAVRHLSIYNVLIKYQRKELLIF